MLARSLYETYDQKGDVNLRSRVYEKKVQAMLLPELFVSCLKHPHTITRRRPFAHLEKQILENERPKIGLAWQK